MALVNLLDPIELKRLVNDTLIHHSYFKLNKEGERVVDDTKLKVDVYDTVKKKVARSREEISKSSITNGELYAQILPDAPGSDPKELPHLDDMQREVRRSLMRKVWGYTQPKRIGFIQKRLGAEGTKLVLCRTTSTRGLDDVEVCFVTDNPDLIMSESVMPQIESLVKKADDLRLHTEMVVDRQPALESRITRELGIGVRRIEATLPKPGETTNGSQPAQTTEASV
jgi:hypothetical protein